MNKTYIANERLQRQWFDRVEGVRTRKLKRPGFELNNKSFTIVHARPVQLKSGKMQITGSAMLVIFCHVKKSMELAMVLFFITYSCAK